MGKWTIGSVFAPRVDRFEHVRKFVKQHLVLPLGVKPNNFPFYRCNIKNRLE